MRCLVDRNRLLNAFDVSTLAVIKALDNREKTGAVLGFVQPDDPHPALLVEVYAIQQRHLLESMFDYGQRLGTTIPLLSPGDILCTCPPAKTLDAGGRVATSQGAVIAIGLGPQPDQALALLIAIKLGHLTSRQALDIGQKEKNTFLCKILPP